MEEIYIKNIKNAIRSIKMGVKSPKEANIGTQLNKLKELNRGMHDELMNNYKAVLIEYKTKNQ